MNQIIITQKQVVRAIHEFKERELHAGKSDTIVTYRKQAIAIAHSETKILKNKPSCGKKKTIN